VRWQGTEQTGTMTDLKLNAAWQLARKSYAKLACDWCPEKGDGAGRRTLNNLPP
jgi:hypothetical protein